MSRRAETVARIEAARVSAIIRANDQAVARDAIAAAVAGGFRAVEFTLTTPGALELITEFSRNRDLVVGAGTVLTVEQARSAVEAGARFLVSPVTDPAVVAEAARLDVACIPGTYTPTEMLAAHRVGADLLKVFPAHHNMADFVRSVLGPLPFLKLFPTAGFTIEDFPAVLAAGAVGLGFVRPLFDPADIGAGRFAAIEDRARRIIRRLAGD